MSIVLLVVDNNSNVFSDWLRDDDAICADSRIASRSGIRVKQGGHRGVFKRKGRVQCLQKWLVSVILWKEFRSRLIQRRQLL